MLYYPYPGWPYAAKAVIQHNYEGTTLRIWITFRLSMKLSSDPLADPVVFDIKPPNEKWIVELDDIEKDIISSEWIDLYTMLLIIESIESEPDKVTVQYDGPDPDLITTWGKQWEAWSAILSYIGWPTTFKAGMIIMWSGSVISIPTGWNLCDGNNGTPDLRDRFVMASGEAYPPNTIAGSAGHTHTGLCLMKTTELPSGGDIAAGDDFNKISTQHFHSVTVFAGGALPPFYSLCYIMKL